MELYVACVGTSSGLDYWENDMRALKFPFDWKKGEDKKVIRMGVCEVKLYKLFFPHDQLDTVMSMVGVEKEGSYVLNRYPMLNKTATMMRGMLGLKKPPLPKEIIEHMMPEQANKAVAVLPLGVKKDKFDKHGIELL